MSADADYRGDRYSVLDVLEELFGKKVGFGDVAEVVAYEAEFYGEGAEGRGDGDWGATGLEVRGGDCRWFNSRGLTK